MKKIPLTKGYVAIVDDEDYPALSQFKWHVRERHVGDSGPTAYAARYVRKEGRKSIQLAMHRHLMNPGPEQEIDHINHDGLDNRRCNLRITDTRGNAQNRRDHSRWGPGIDKGGGWRPFREQLPFRARIFVGGKSHLVGHFATPEEAVAARAHYLHAYQFSCALAGVE